MKNVVLVVAEKQFRDEEYQIPKDVLIQAGFKVITASTTKEEIVGSYGLKAKPDTLLADLEVSGLDALVFVGGGGSSQYFDDTMAHDYARQAYDQEKVVGAICIAPVILANAGILAGKKATVYPDGTETLIKKGATYTGASVEIDGRVITGNGPEAAPEFAAALSKMLQN